VRGAEPRTDFQLHLARAAAPQRCETHARLQRGRSVIAAFLGTSIAIIGYIGGGACKAPKMMQGVNV
jgi:hypothetical protein